ncbi:MAG: SDR family oxidoreductase [Pseudomonadota bacterium]
MTDKVSLVVGGSSGIGLATAKAFRAAGYITIIAGRNQEKGASTALEHQLEFYPCDVVDPDSSAQLVEKIINKYGHLNAAFNNAGWEGPAVPTDEISETDWQTMINTKLNGVWRCMAAELSAMKNQGFGAIVNMAGNWGLVGFPNFAAYCAAAHGIMGVTKSAAMEYAGKGLRINAVCPGAVDAPMLDRMVGGNEDVKQSFGEQLAIGRICKPEEVAEAVLWLCSDSASYVNGVGLNLDGGG